MSQEAVDDVESGRLEESNTSIPISPLQQQRQPLGSLHFSAATGLILTYLIEIGVQIFLMVNCCQSFVLVTSGWPLFLTISSVLSSLLVTIVSIVWVCRGLDFAGRLCGRLLCYVMHSLLLGLLWRYLKLAFAYDHADQAEFVTLRIFQTYIQSLPLTSIHLAWLITENCSSVTFCLVVAEMLSVTAALTISSYIKRREEKEGKTPVVEINNTHSTKCTTTAIWFKVLKVELSVVGRVMLICCRLIVVGIVIVHLNYWTSLAVVAHFILSFTWITVTERMYSKSSSSTVEADGECNLTTERNSRNKFVTRVTRFVYVLFWDVSLDLVGSTNVCSWLLPVLLVVGENGAMIMYHWYDQPEFFVTITSGTCLFLGLLLCFSLNFIDNTNNATNTSLCCSLRPMHSKKKDKSQQTQSVPVIDPSEKNESEQSHKVNHENDGMSIERIGALNTSAANQNKNCSWDLRIGKPFIVANNYTNISEVLMTKARATASGANGEKRRKNLMKGMSVPPEVLVYRASPPAAPGASVPTLIQSPLVPATTWVPDTCCNDSNGSSNSRNTNTLLESANNPTDHDNDMVMDNDMDIDNPHFVFYYPTKTNGNSTVTGELRKLSHRSGSVSATNSNKGVSPATTRNNANKRKPASPATSFTSFSSLRKIRTSTPVEIRKASRVIMNYPKHHKVPDSKTVSRCLCQVERAPCSGEVGTDLYDKLMEDSYGILICEGEPSHGSRRTCESKDETRLHSLLPSIFHANNKLKVLCAKCLQNHDPLLTNCLEEDQVPVQHSIESKDKSRYHHHHSSSSYITNCRVPPIPSIVSVMPNVIHSDSTDYPSETEMTWNLQGDDQISMSSHLSTATYTTWPHQSQPNLSMWTTSTMMPQSRFPKEFTSLEYVRTWLLTSQARLRHYHHQKTRAAKKVNRSKTMMTQNRQVRSASVGREVIGTVSQNQRKIGRRQGPVGRGQSPQSHHEVISITPSFQPPPKQKQHPVLPHSVISHHVEMCAHADCPRHSTFTNDDSDVCYKDLEIVV